MLVRSGQPEHVDSADALNAILALPVADLRTLALAVRGARGALKSGTAAALAAEVLLILEGQIEGRVVGAQPVTPGARVGVGTPEAETGFGAAVTAGAA